MSAKIGASAAEMAQALAAGETTSVELTQAHLERIEAVDGGLNAFLHVASESAWLTRRPVTSVVVQVN